MMKGGNFNSVMKLRCPSFSDIIAFMDKYYNKSDTLYLLHCMYKCFCLIMEIIFWCLYVVCMASRDSAVGIATGYGLDCRRVGVQVLVRTRMFSFSRRPDRPCGPLSLLSYGYRWLSFPGVKRLGCEADHSPASSAEVKKMWLYTSTPPYAFIA
jgi:hypothetical protein